jgi:hypothetical protein
LFWGLYSIKAEIERPKSCCIFIALFAGNLTPQPTTSMFSDQGLYVWSDKEPVHGQLSHRGGVGSTGAQKGGSLSGLPDLSWYNLPKWGKIFQMTIKHTKRKQDIPNDRKIHQMALKCIDIFGCKTLQNLPKLSFLVRKCTIWQPWSLPSEKLLRRGCNFRFLLIVSTGRRTIRKHCTEGSGKKFFPCYYFVRAAAEQTVAAGCCARTHKKR